jgi:hypothetical protein
MAKRAVTHIRPKQLFSIAISGEPSGDRTLDLLIKSQIGKESSHVPPAIVALLLASWPAKNGLDFAAERSIAVGGRGEERLT